MASFKGVGWRELLNSVDMNTANTMTRDELSPIVSRLSAVANKRINRMRDKGIYQFPIEHYGAAGKSVGGLKKEFGKLVTFLSNDVWSLSGLNKLQDEMRDRAQREGVEMPRVSTKEFSDRMSTGLGIFIYGKQMGYWERMQWDSEQALEISRKIVQENPDLNNFEYMDKANELFDDFRRKQEEDYRQQNNVDTSSFFEI